MPKMTKQKIVDLIKESLEEYMTTEAGCPASYEDEASMHMPPPEMSMDDGFAGEPMDGAEQSKMDQLLDMMQQVLMKLDGKEPMQEPIEMRETKRKKTKK